MCINNFNCKSYFKIILEEEKFSLRVLSNFASTIRIADNFMFLYINI